LKFLIIDAYSEQSRANLEKAGMSFAWKLYADMLLDFLPEADYTVFHPSDKGAEFPSEKDLEAFSGIIWTGADLNINHLHIPSIAAQIELAKDAYEAGVPSCGSCWGIQMAAVAAGGTVEPNPRGREMGIGRKILLTEEGRRHPMMEGKPPVFDGFESHYDMVVQLPEGAKVLATNSFTQIQALAVTHKRGSFWATQYHPEYNLHEMARLTVAREEVLTEQGFFADHEDFEYFVSRWELLHENPERSDLRWQTGIDDDILSEDIRRREFANWIRHLVLPHAQKKE
jgi:GMP synthase (glutamine-hydrolysing)